MAIASNHGSGYVLTINEQEAEALIYLTGNVLSSTGPLYRRAEAVWDALDPIVRGDRVEYVVDGVEYDTHEPFDIRIVE